MTSSSTSEPLATLARRIVDQPAAREVVPHLPGESFRWMTHDYPASIARWNYHPEIEIHLIRKGLGSYIVGDRVGTFGPGHVAVIGPDLPHDWMSDLAPDEVIVERDAVIQFDMPWLNRATEALPELHEVHPFLEECATGVEILGESSVEAAAQIERVGATSGVERLANMVALLGFFSRIPPSDKRPIAQTWRPSPLDGDAKAAADAGLAYILDNFNSQIRMSEAAEIARMSEPTFSRHFKKAAGVTFSEMVKRLRIANACRLLGQTDNSVATICSAVGYGNLANFNRQFLAEMGMSPRAYRNLAGDARPDGPALLLPRSAP